MWPIYEHKKLIKKSTIFITCRVSNKMPLDRNSTKTVQIKEYSYTTINQKIIKRNNYHTNKHNHLKSKHTQIVNIN